MRNRPVMVSFDGSIPGGFLQWMLTVYGYDLADYWGRARGDIR